MAETTPTEFPRPASIDRPAEHAAHVESRPPADWGFIRDLLADAVEALEDAQKGLVEIGNDEYRRGISTSQRSGPSEGMQARLQWLLPELEKGLRDAERFSERFVCEECGKALAYDETDEANIPSTHRGRSCYVVKTVCSPCAAALDPANQPREGDR
ncbi:MAG: hypothetical protein ACQGVC_18095 [Myxococcota bacterium]